MHRCLYNGQNLALRHVRRVCQVVTLLYATAAFLLPVSALCAVVSFDTDGMPLIDGERTFLYGTYRDPSDNWGAFAGVLEGGFNLTHDYSFEALSWNLTSSGKTINDWINQASQYLDLAYQNGVGVNLGLPRRAVFDGNAAAISSAVNALKNKPALRFWTIMDEPLLQTGQGLTPTKMQTAYIAIKAADPDHPAIVVDNLREDRILPYTPQQMWEYTDAVWIDKYPILSTGPTSEDLVPTYTAFLDAVAQSNVFIGGSVLQGHDLRTFYPENNPIPLTAENILPTKEQLRSQVHLSISVGAGVSAFYWAPRSLWDLRADSPDQWQNFVEIGQDMATLLDVLPSQEVVPALSVTSAVNGMQRNLTDPEVDIQSWSRAKDGNHYLGITNPGGWYESDIWGFDDVVGAYVDLDWSVYSKVAILKDGQWVTVMTNPDGTGWSIDSGAFDGLYSSFAGQRLTLILDAYDTIILRMWTPIPGDLDDDGFVGLADLDIILQAWNQSVETGAPPDPSGDEFVGLADLDLVLRNWNIGSPPTSNDLNIPEPSGAGLLVCITMLGMVCRLRRR